MGSTYIYDLVVKIWCIWSDFKNKNFKNFLEVFSLGFARSSCIPPQKKYNSNNKQTNILPTYGTVFLL